MAPRTAKDPAHGRWPDAVCQAVAALAQQHRSPAGSLRVLVGTGGARLAGPYLEARARVVGIREEGDDDPRYHVRLPADEHGLPWPHRLDDADLVVMPCIDPSRDVNHALGAVARALAAGGLAVLGLPSRAPADDAATPWLGGHIARARLEQRHCERLWVDERGWFEAVVVADPRPASALPAALAALDRTACVDRSRVLQAIEQTPWSRPEAASLVGSTGALRAALHRQLATGEPDVRTLPWEALAAHSVPALANGGEERDEPPGRDVLAIMPHPDDESIYAGGTLAGLQVAGQRVGLVVATDGAGGRQGSATAEHGGLAGRRAHELLAAADALGLRGLRYLGWSDFGKYRDAARTSPVTAGDALRTWGLDPALEQLVAEIRRERPRVLVGLDPEADPNLSLHGHHLGLGVLVAVAFHAAADPSFAPHLGAAWACDEHRVMAPLAHARWGEAFDVDRDAKRRALQAHATQAYSTARLLEALDDPQRPAVELTRRVQARRVRPWWLVRRSESHGAVDDGIDWAAEATRVRALPRPRAALGELLRRQAELVPHEPAVDQSLRLLARDDAVTVVTGQQVGLLGGPAYTLAKALSAVALARRLQQRGVPAVPVFWLASQDHDLREAQRVGRLDGPALQLGLVDTGAPVGPRTLGPGIRGLCERWASELPGAHPEILALVERAYRPEHDFTTAFALLVREAMRGTGLLLLDPMDPAFVRLSQPLLRRALVEAPTVERALAAARERLRSRGLAEVVPTAREHTLVFAHGAEPEHGARRRVAEPTADRLEALERWPERFSPSALLRPVVQDAVLPTIAYVGGPTELRYLAQTDELYAWAGVPQPRAVPRVSLQLAHTRDLAALHELGDASRPAALHGAARPLERIGRAALSAAAHAVLDEVEAALARLDRARPRASIDVGELRERIAGIERHMAGALSSLPRMARCWPRIQAVLRERTAAALDGGTVVPARALTRLRHGLFGLRRSLLRDGRRSRPEAVAAWHRTSTRPTPPERRVSVAELLARTSPELPRAMVAALEAQLSPALAIRIGGGP